LTDLKVQSETTQPGQFPTWDYYVDPEKNIVPFIEGIEGDSQAAALSAFINKNSIPQLPQQGVPWTDFLTGDASFADVDTMIRYNLNVGNLAFQPTYDIVNGRLVCTVVKQ